MVGLKMCKQERGKKKKTLASPHQLLCSSPCDAAIEVSALLQPWLDSISDGPKLERPGDTNREGEKMKMVLARRGV